MRKSLLALAIAALASFTATEAMAQTCFGVPVAQGQKAAYAAVGFPTLATSFHVGGAMALQGPLVVGAELHHTSFDLGAGSSNGFEVTGAYQVKLEGSSPVSVCPLGKVGFDFSDGDNLFTLGAGAGISTDVKLSNPEYVIYPYVTPMIVHMRADGASDTRFAFAFGGNFAFNKYYIGAQFYKAVGAGDAFRIQAGLNF
jgi:hypothetical protein